MCQTCAQYDESEIRALKFTIPHELMKSLRRFSVPWTISPLSRSHSHSLQFNKRPIELENKKRVFTHFASQAFLHELWWDRDEARQIHLKTIQILLFLTFCYSNLFHGKKKHAQKKTIAFLCKHVYMKSRSRLERVMKFQRYRFKLYILDCREMKDMAELCTFLAKYLASARLLSR